MKNKLQKTILGVVVFLFMLPLFACNLFWITSEIDDFDAFLARLSRGEFTQSQSVVSQIEGFTPLINARFDFGMPFTEGQYTFAYIGGFNVIVSEYGTLYHSGNLAGFQITYDKFIFEQDALKGVRCVFNRLIVPANYTEIHILGNSILATNKEGKSDIFYRGNLIHSNLSTVQLFDRSTLLMGGRLYDLQLNSLTVGDNNQYTVVSGLDKLDFRIITNGELFGFANLYTNVVLSPQWQRASGFNEFGFSSVNLTDGQYVIIDTQGRVVVTEQNDKLPVRYDGEFITALDTIRSNLFGIFDSNFNEITSSRFSSIYRHKIWHGGIVIYNAPHISRRFYLIDNGFIPNEYIEIWAFENHFIGKNLDGRYSLYDKNLRIIKKEAQYIGFNGSVLTIRYGGGVYYYVKS
ncbi:MAG: hypothetical protein FWE13_04960 [Firmicutes bacterium]|nr:hypothetical protein [Bacillota bacterium]